MGGPGEGSAGSGMGGSGVGGTGSTGLGSLGFGPGGGAGMGEGSSGVMERGVFDLRSYGSPSLAPLPGHPHISARHRFAKSVGIGGFLAAVGATIYCGIGIFTNIHNYNLKWN